VSASTSVGRTRSWQGAVLHDPMLHVFRLGPIPIQGRSVFAYAGFDEQGPLKPELAHSDAEGLRALAAAAGGEPLRCEPALAEAGRPFGFEPAPLPDSIFLARAALAYGLALGPGAGRPGPEVFARFLESCASFRRAQPWEIFDSIEALPATLTTAGWTRSGEASVLGSGGKEYGVALYDERGALRRVADLMERGRVKESRRSDALAVTLDEEPAWAASAIEDAFGLPRLPVPLRVKRGSASPATGDELLGAAALLEAVAVLAGSGDADDAEATVEAGGRKAAVHVGPPEGEEEGDLEPEFVVVPATAAAREKTVEEKSASRTARAREVVVARVVEVGDRAFLAGCHPRPLPPRAADEARRRLRAELRVRAAKVPAAKLRQATADGTIFRVWQETVAELAARPLPRLQNTDGEDLLLTVDRFDLAAGGAGEARRRLLEIPGAEAADGEADETAAIAFSKPGNARSGMLPTTLVGRALLGGGTLKLETNSRERADRLRSLVEERLGPLVTFRVREHMDPVAQLSGREGRPVHPAEPPPAEVLEVMRRLQTEHYRRWLDESIPALGGLTPREAARRKGAPRRELDVLLAEMEHGEAGRPEAGRVDVAGLRRELGLERVPEDRP
jgi:hypothetical protein